MTKEQYITIKQALEWIGCLDARFSGSMDEAYRAAIDALIEMRSEESWTDGDD